MTSRPLFRSPSPSLSTVSQSQQRGLEVSSSDSDSDHHGSSTQKRQRTLATTEKGRRKWRYQQERISTAKLGKLDITREARKRFSEKVFDLDPAAEVQPNGLSVRCGPCGIWINLRAPNEIRRFLEHRKTGACQKSRNSGWIATSLSRFGFKVVPKPELIPSPKPLMVSVPCPGLTRSANPKVNQYLSRTAMPGGGARSKLALSLLVFGRKWVELNLKECKVVLRRVALEYQWINSHAAGSVHSKNCEASVQQPQGESGERDPSPCSSCLALLRNHRFQSAINRKCPEDAKLKFVPIAYRCPVLGDIYAKHMGVRELIEAVST